MNSITRQTQVHCDRANFGRGVRVSIYNEAADGTVSVAKPLVFERLAEGAVEESTATLPMSTAQALMDELWQCGLRPSEGSGSAGSLAATERHLKDMQTIAMGLLKPHGV